MTKTLAATAVTALALALPMGPASAHFQLVYSPEANIDRPGEIPLELIFWHPMDAGHAMNMAMPEELFYVFRGERNDLMESVSQTTFRSGESEATSFEATLPVRRNGDYIVALVPAPYYEEAEDIFIQQITKVFFNKGGLPTGWNEPVGLPTEIVPMNKPTNVIVGSTFTGQLMAEGEPVAGAEVEIEFMAAEPDVATNSAGEPSVSDPAGGGIVAVTDANGVFTFGIPRAGYWGFAALGSGPDKEHEGKELSQDAVIWVRAYELD